MICTSSMPAVSDIPEAPQSLDGLSEKSLLKGMIVGTIGSDAGDRREGMSGCRAQLYASLNTEAEPTSPEAAMRYSSANSTKKGTRPV